MLRRCKHLFCRHLWSVCRQIWIYLAAKLCISGGKTLPCTGIKEENAVRVYLKRQEQELPVAIEGCFVSNEACQNINVCVEPIAKPSRVRTRRSASLPDCLFSTAFVYLWEGGRDGARPSLAAYLVRHLCIYGRAALCRGRVLQLALYAKCH